MPRDTDRRASERAVIYAGILGNLSLEEINALLEDIPGCKQLNPNSHDSMRRTYWQPWLDGIGIQPPDPKTGKNPFGGYIYHPLPMGDLPRR